MLGCLQQFSCTVPVMTLAADAQHWQASVHALLALTGNDQALDAFALPSQSRADATKAALKVLHSCLTARSTKFAGLSLCVWQALHQYAVAGRGPAGLSLKAQPGLLVDGFDAEQIWAQLAPQAAAVASRARRLLRAAPAESTHLISRQTDRDLDGEPQSELCRGFATRADYAACCRAASRRAVRR